jgi:RNA polymerase sigma-70 factor
MAILNEKEILVKINQGDEAGLEGLFVLYYKPLCVFALNFIDSYEEAEDLIQDLFVKFWERRGNTAFQGSLRAYLFSSVQHNCIKLIKSRRKYHFDGIENYEDLLEDKYTSVEMEEERERLYAEIEKLPEQCRKVFEAIILKDMKYKEAAELLGLSVNTVKTHLARAMKQLRSSLHIIVLVMLR